MIGNLTDRGITESLAGLREARAAIVQQRQDAMRRLAEAEAEVNRLGRILSATETVIEDYEGERQARAAGMAAT